MRDDEKVFEDNAEMRVLLKALPREGASPEFAEKVMSRVRDFDSPSTRISWTERRWAFGLAAAVLLLAFLTPLAIRALRSGDGTVSLAERAVQPRQTSLESLLSENRRLTADVQGLRNAMDGRAPVVYLGGDDSIDFVFDLSRAGRRGPGGRRMPSAELLPVSVKPNR